MRRTIQFVKPWPDGNPSTCVYDALIGAVGYEQRARYLPGVFSQQSDKLFACAFDNRKVLSYSENLDWFAKNRFEVAEINDEQFGSWCENIVERLDDPPQGQPLKICIDISSFTRLRIATLIASLLKADAPFCIEVDFLYAPARYSKPASDDGPIVTSKPVIDLFAGWSSEPQNPPITIFGLGYERDRAVGVMEYIEPVSVWAYKPEGEDPRYSAELKRANKSLWDVIPTNHIISYLVDRPFDCFTSLEALVYGTAQSARPILIPFGPKIFALNCLLVACVHFPTVAVWRVSSGEYDVPSDRIPTGKILGLKAGLSADPGHKETPDGDSVM